MSQVITNAFEHYWQSSLAAEQPVVLDEFILADIPNLDITSPIDPDTGLPPESQIVHRQNVDQRGRINNNAVAYTIVMDTTFGDFSFNAMYLRNKQNGVIGMIVYKGRETKLKTDQTTGQTGNSLVKSMLMGYDQAAEATLTHVDAGTWQIDYAARLRGQDEDLRQLASQLYGHHTFIGDGFKVVQQDGGHQVTQGVAIVGGLRIELKQPQVIYPGTKPIGVWVDVHRSGSLLSEHQNHFTIITSVADLTDNVDSNGYPHYVAKLATVQADSTVIDGRGQGGSSGSGAIPDTFALWTRSMAEAGYDLIGQFGSKITIQNAKQVVLSKDGKDVYAWLGELPKEVSAGATLESTGGIGPGLWLSVGVDTLRYQLATPGGAGWVGGQAKPVTWSGFSGGADLSGVKNSTAAFSSMFAPGGSHFIPDGEYNFGGMDFNPDYAPTVMVAGPKVKFLNGKMNLGGLGKLMPNEGQPIWSQHLIRRKYSAHDGWMGYGNIYQLASVAESNVPHSGVGGSQVTAVYGRGFANAEGAHAFGGNFAAYGNFPTAYPVGVEINVGNYVEDGIGGVGCQVISNGRSIMRAAYFVGSAVSDSNFSSGVELSIDETDNFVDQAILLGNKNTSNFHQSPRGIRSRHVTFTTAELDLPSLFVGPTRFDVAAGGNRVEVRGSAIGGGSVRVLATGDDANTNLVLHGKGTGNVMVASSLRPETANTLTCGTASAPWSGGFTQAAFTVISDENYKTELLDITDDILDAWQEAAWAQYQYRDRVEAKGDDNARWHFGIGARRVVEIFEKRGIDAHKFAFICYDEWDDQYVKVQTNEGVKITKTRTVKKEVMVTTTREVFVDEYQLDGKKIKKAVIEEYQTPKLIQVYVFNNDGSPRIDDDGVRVAVFNPVMEDVTETYTENAAPEYVDVLETPAGSRYGIRYEEALVLEAALQRRNHLRQQEVNENIFNSLKEFSERICVGG